MTGAANPRGTKLEGPRLEQARAALAKARAANEMKKARREAMSDAGPDASTVERIIAVADSPEQAGTVKNFSISDTETLALGLGMLFTIGTRILSRSAIGTTEGAMNETEIEQITRPICRIFLRHAPKAWGASGDLTDIACIVLVAGAYGLRLYDLSAERKDGQQRTQQQPQTAPIGTSVPLNGWTTPIIRSVGQPST